MITKKLTYSEENPLVFCVICRKGMYWARNFFLMNGKVHEAQIQHFKDCEEKYGGHDGYLSAQRQNRMDIIEFNKKLKEHQKKFSL